MSNPFNLYNQFKIAIINDSIDSCIENFKVLLKKGYVEIEKSDKVDFQNVCITPDLEYRPTESRFLLYEPLSNPSQTVFFTNYVDGWHTAVYNYSRLFNKQVFLLGFTMNKSKYEPAWFFQYLQSAGKEVNERVVYLIKEGKWVFYEKGDPLPIEEVSNYSKRYKKDRLNNEIIFGYLKSAGYDLQNDEFYKTNKKVHLCKYY